MQSKVKKISLERRILPDDQPFRHIHITLLPHKTPLSSQHSFSE